MWKRINSDLICTSSAGCTGPKAIKLTNNPSIMTYGNLHISKKILTKAKKFKNFLVLEREDFVIFSINNQLIE